MLRNFKKPVTNKSILTLLTFLSFSFSMKAQNNIKGIITDERQKPLKAATVLLLTGTDSSMQKSALTDEKGEYYFTEISVGYYLISTNIIGYKKTYSPITLAGADIDMKSIILINESMTLNEVVVVATKPFLEQKADKLVVNVENSATSAGSNALEVLKKVPGVIIRNDKVSVAGKSNVMILIDGRSSQYNDINQVLKDVSAANISKIELITNPGAKYDAAGGSIINVILKKNAKLGTNGSIALSTGMGLYNNKKEGVDRNFFRYSPSINLNHREGKVNIFGSYSYNHRNWFEYNEFDRNIELERYFQKNLFYYKVNSHNYRLGMDVYADTKNTFGVLFSGFNRDGGSNMTNNTEQFVSSSNQLVNTFQTLNNIKLKRNNFAFNLNWKHAFDSLGKELNVDVDYSKFNINNNSNIINDAGSSNKSLSNQLVDNPVKFGVFKIDYTHPINVNTKLELGAKSSYATIDNFLTYTQNGTMDNDRSTEFLYTENINAAYINYNQKYGKWLFTGGLRTEQTIANGKSVGTEVVNRNYWQLFPSAFITRNFNTHFAAVAQYSRRVDRPSYQQQNPFTLFMDSLTFSRGNPTLKPQITDAYKFSVTYDKQPFFAVSYNKTNDVIFNDAPKQEGNKTFTTPENLAQFKNLAFELNFPIQFGKKISGFAGNQAILNHYTANYLGGKYDGKKWNWLAYWEVGYKPANTWNIEVSGYYISSFLTEFFTIKSQGSLNFAIQKSVIENRGKFTLNFNDVLFTEKTTGSVLYQDINVKFRMREDTRNVRLSFTLSFGNQKLNAARSRKTAADVEAGRVKTK